MKVLHFITSLRTGGAEHVVRDIAPKLAALGHDVEILVMDGTRTALLEQVESEGIKVSALCHGWRAMRNPFLLPELVAFLRKGKFDIVHSHNTTCQMMAAIASMIIKAGYVTTEHNTTNRRRNWRWFKPIDRWMYGRYKNIICVGEDVRKSLVNYLPGSSDNVTVISNGINSARFREALPADDIASRTGHKILMTAAFRAQKDHKTIINAMACLPEDYLLFLAGGAETDQDKKVLNECKELVKQKGLDGRIFFLGIRLDIPSLMAACDVIVLSSHYEGKSIAALEGMASGKPFIASAVEGLEDLVKGTGILFPEGNERALADSIRQVIEDQAYAEMIAPRCQKLVSRMDVSQTAKAYSEVYQEIL